MSPFQEFLRRLGLSEFPSLERIIASMDPIAWTLVLLLVGAVVLGVYFSLSTRYRFLQPDEIEASTEILLSRLKQDPTHLTPSAILNRLGAEATLDLLEYGDQITAKQWRFEWNGVREELLTLLASQDAFGPIRALAQYYQSTDTREPDSLRIRRTALIHKLGQRRYLEPSPDGLPAQLRLHRHPAEQLGDLGFDGPTVWLDPGQEALPTEGPIVEIEPVEFRTVDEASVRLKIQRTPVAGGGFELRLQKRKRMWVVTEERIDWTL